jgi:hypothetical protein
VTIREEAYEKPMNEDFLPHNNAGHFIDEGFHPLAAFLNLLG